MKSHWKVFFPNNEENSYSETIDIFLKRQVYLDATLSVILHLDGDILLSFSHMFKDIEGYNVLHHYTHEITPENKEVELRNLKNFISMNLLVQSVENFESFLKKTIDILPSTVSKKSLLIEKLKNSFCRNKKRNHGFRSNKDRIKHIKKQCLKVAQILAVPHYKLIYDTFLVIENVRHLTVHNKMNLKSELNSERKEFKDYFKIEIIEERKYIFINTEKAQQLMLQISTLGYIIFQSISNQYNLPVSAAKF